MQTISHLRSSAPRHLERLRTHDFRASLTVVGLVFCSMTVFLLSSVATHLGLN